MYLVVKMLGVCPVCKMGLLKRVRDDGYVYQCDHCFSKILPRISWKIVEENKPQERRGK